MATTPLNKKRVASIGSASAFHASLGPDSTARKRSRGAGVEEADVVLVSSDGRRFPFSSRQLLASSPTWSTLLPSSLPLLPLAEQLSVRPASPSPSVATSHSATPAPEQQEPDGRPEVLLPESGECLEYVLAFMRHAPVAQREVEFPRDWETVRALDRYSIWRGIDTFTSYFAQTPDLTLLPTSRPRRQPSLPAAHLAPAFAFSLLFQLPSLSRSTALQIAKQYSCNPEGMTEVVAELKTAKREWDIEGEEVERLLSYLLLRTLALSSLRSSALLNLKSFDDEYDCEHSCRGLIYARLVTLLSTTSRKKARKLAFLSREEGGRGNEDGRVFDCKDCDERWDAVVEKVVEGLEELPECPFGVEQGVDEEE
ncbi:hypothetical protein JCM8547_002463 [Rhodosporidiobolus lusitaniae]